MATTPNLNIMNVDLSRLLNEPITAATVDGQIYSSLVRTNFLQEALNFHEQRAFVEGTFNTVCPEYIKASGALNTASGGYYTGQEFLTYPTDFSYLVGGRVGENLIVNPDFELGSTGWTLGGTASIVSTQHNRGSYACKFDNAVDVLYQDIPVIGNKEYFLTFSPVYTGSAPAPRVEILDQTNNTYWDVTKKAFVGGETPNTITITTSFTPNTITFATVSNCTSIRVYFTGASNNNNDWYLDTVSCGAISYPVNIAPVEEEPRINANQLPMSNPSLTNAYLVDMGGQINVYPPTLRDNIFFINYLKYEGLVVNTGSDGVEISAKPALRTMLTNLAAFFGQLKSGSAHAGLAQTYWQLYEMSYAQQTGRTPAPAPIQ